MLLAELPKRVDYNAAADAVANLPTLMRQARGTSSLTVTAKQAGLTSTTLSRIEAGTTTLSQTTILTCLRWLATR